MATIQKHYSKAQLVQIVIWLSIPTILLLLPADYFDSGKSMCISKLLLDMECYGCGITRAFQHFLHLDFAVAYQYNKLIVIVFPLLALLWLKQLLAQFGIVILKWL